jgi:hypothetical protein
MGISIDVDSIITPKERHRYGPPNYQDYQCERVKRLCEAFGWTHAPWAEPSAVRGETNTSCNASRYYLLLWVARSHARGVAFQRFDEEQVAALTPEESLMFPHLLKRAPWTNYYLPVDFAEPKFFENEFGLISAGSSKRLHAELTVLESVIHEYCEQRGKDNLVEKQLREGQAHHTWDSVDDLCQTLLFATQESMDLNLPLLLYG